MAATIVDIKNMTGLSLATISKYLNGGNVLPENREKLDAAVKELNYEVNEIARGLATKRTRTIGVVVYSIARIFNGMMLHHIGNALREAGYGMLICDSNDNAELEKKNIKFLVGKKVDGIIVLPVSGTADILKPALDAKLPVVYLDRPSKESFADCVRIDNRAAAKKAVNQLIEMGHRKIAVIGSQVEYTGIERCNGYLDAMKPVVDFIPPEYQKRGRHSIEFGHESMRALLSLKDRPTAVFMTNYEITLGAVMAVNESDFSCPEDISILGFDDLILSNVVKPRVCVVVQPMQEMAELAVKRLLQRIDGDEGAFTETVLSTTMLEGNSIKDIRIG